MIIFETIEIYRYSWFLFVDYLVGKGIFPESCLFTGIADDGFEFVLFIIFYSFKIFPSYFPKLSDVPLIIPWTCLDKGRYLALNWCRFTAETLDMLFVIQKMVVLLFLGFRNEGLTGLRRWWKMEYFRFEQRGKMRGGKLSTLCSPTRGQFALVFL